MRRPLILIIDDHRDTLDTYRLILESSEFNVITAWNASTGYDQLTRYQPHLILTDLAMPDMTGIEFIQWIRRTAEFMNIPIVAMSAYEYSYLEAAIAAGANGVFHKIDDLNKLIRILNRALADAGYERATSA
jgi:CheY-like chemotaxis protein